MNSLDKTGQLVAIFRNPCSYHQKVGTAKVIKMLSAEPYTCLIGNKTGTLFTAEVKYLDKEVPVKTEQWFSASEVIPEKIYFY